MNTLIVKLSDKRQVLKMRIAARKKAHRGHADLDAKLLAATIKQLHAERRWERQQGKVT
jgi:hypothetical protein